MKTFALILMSTTYSGSWQGQTSHMPPVERAGYTIEQCEAEAERWEGVTFFDNGSGDGVYRVREAYCRADPELVEEAAEEEHRPTMSGGVPVWVR